MEIYGNLNVKYFFRKIICFVYFRKVFNFKVLHKTKQER